MSERRFYLSEVTEHSYYYEITGAITLTELKRRIHIIEESDFGPDSQIQVLLHGEELYSHDFMTEDPPTETREEWIRRMPFELSLDAWENWILDMQQWFREEPPR